MTLAPRVILAARASLFIATLLLPACKEAGIANRCPGTPEPRCATRVVCDEDRNRGCQVCRCESPAFAPVQQPHGAPAAAPP